MSDDEFSDSDESDSDDDLSTNIVKNIILEDVKQISVKLENENNMPREINLAEKLPQIISTTADELDDVDSLSDDEDNPDENPLTRSPPIEEAIDYSKFTVPRLKEIAIEKGFTNFKKLRKSGLVELLSK